MSALMHTAAAGLRSAMTRQAVTAHNLANVATPGFRADLDVAQSIWIGRDSASVRSGLNGIDTAAGATTPTGRPLDVALERQALLTVQAGNGEAYTRRGDLMRSSAGILTTHDGRPVLGSGGPMPLPDGDVTIHPDGRVSVTNGAGEVAEVGRLKLANPAGAVLEKDAEGLLRAPAGGVLPEDPDARLRSGHLESANIDATGALVAMIDAQRGWDQQLRLLTTARDLDEAGTNLMRLSS